MNSQVKNEKLWLNALFDLKSMRSRQTKCQKQQSTHLLIHSSDWARQMIWIVNVIVVLLMNSRVRKNKRLDLCQTTWLLILKKRNYWISLWINSVFMRGRGDKNYWKSLEMSSLKLKKTNSTDPKSIKNPSN